MADPETQRFFSVVSLWEIVIKAAQRRGDFLIDADSLRRGLLANGYAELTVLGPHALFVARLPVLHKDPFDRLLVAQALVEGFVLVTADATVAAYSDSILKI